MNYLTVVRTAEFRLGVLSALIFFNTVTLLPLLYFSRVPVVARVAVRRPSISLLSCLVFILGGVALSHISGSIMSDAHLNSRTLTSLHTLIQQASRTDPILCVFLIGFLAPVCEELLFRGYIQSRLVRRLGPFVGIVLTSIAFGIFHRDLYQGLFAVAIGLFQGAVAYRAQSIIPAIFMHIAVNTTAVLVTLSDASLAYHSVPVSIAACIIFPASLYLLIKLPAPLPVYLQWRGKVGPSPF